MPAPQQPILETRGLTIRFGGHVAVNEVSCSFHPGTLTAIVGPNGAGKTTYFNLVSGQLRPSAGRVLLYGEDITGDPAPVRTRKGMGRAFQLTNLFPLLSVRENVRLAVQARARSGLNLLSMWSRHTDLIEKAEHYLGRVGLADRGSALASTLPHGDQRKLEVAMLLALEPDIFMFDEPTAGMSVDEVPVILGLIHDIKSQKDKTILLVEHKMDVVRSLSDRIIVLHQGALVADGLPAEVIASPIVQEAYLGISADA
jgi:branched-chain amino acid transport system ATP-binding protein